MKSARVLLPHTMIGSYSLGWVVVVVVALVCTGGFTQAAARSSRTTLALPREEEEPGKAVDGSAVFLATVSAGTSSALRIAEVLHPRPVQMPGHEAAGKDELSAASRSSSVPRAITKSRPAQRRTRRRSLARRLSKKQKSAAHYERLLVDQIDYASARTHPPTEPP